jgi:predicted nucleic acid-binding protein
MTYLDSSVLVKRYLKEDSTDVVRSIIAEARVVATSKLVYPEILSAFMRKHRTGEIERKSLEAIIGQFVTDWDKLFVVEFHDELLKTVKVLIEKYPLKGADTVHLSSALWLQQETKMKLTFVASDVVLLDAAQAENLKAINPLNLSE